MELLQQDKGQSWLCRAHHVEQLKQPINRSIYTYAVPQRGIEGRGTRQSAVEEPKNDAK